MKVATSGRCQIRLLIASVLVLLVTVFPVCTGSVGWAQTLARMNVGVVGGTVPAAGYTNYTTDPDMVSYWLMEQATQSNAPSGGASNELSYSSDGSGPEQSSDHKEGSYSSVHVAANWEVFSRSDANLSAGFPGKSSGGWTGSISAGAWVKLDSSGEHKLLFKWLNENQFSFILKVNTSTQARFCISTNGWNDNIVDGSTTLSSNGTTWTHIVGVFDDTNNLLHIYVNGASDATAVSISGSMFLGTDELRAAHMTGHIDEVFIMKRALSSTEIAEIYNHGLAGDR